MNGIDKAPEAELLSRSFLLNCSVSVTGNDWPLPSIDSADAWLPGSVVYVFGQGTVEVDISYKLQGISHLSS
jgi:hypothetical protein